MGHFAYYNFTQCFERDYVTGLVRNSGMFWESGAFAGYILVAFMLNIMNLESMFERISSPFVSWREYRALSVNMKDWIMKFAYKNIWECNASGARQIIKGIKYHLGRTTWDERVTYMMNPDAQYFHVDEILRDVFYIPDKRKIPVNPIIVSQQYPQHCTKGMIWY